MGLAVEGVVENLVSDPILNEVQRILHKKFSWDPKEAHAAANWLMLISINVRPTKRFNVITDEADNRILECAVGGKADFIVSGDRHLKDLKRFQAIRIVDPATFLMIIEDR